MGYKEDIKRIGIQLDELTSHLMQDLAFGIQGDLAEETPVDTGWAAANWWFGVGTPPVGNSGNKGDVGGREAKQQSTVAEVASYQIKSAQPIYITNGVPYIRNLNEGSSRKAPAMFVDAAVMRNVRRVQALADKGVKL